MRAPDDTMASVHDLDTDVINSVHVSVWEKKMHNALSGEHKALTEILCLLYIYL